MDRPLHAWSKATLTQEVAVDTGLTKRLDSSYDEALRRLPELLKSEGFGVLTGIDVKETLQKKLLASAIGSSLAACMPDFEDFCTVRQSVREGIDVRVEVRRRDEEPPA
jgi:hypothetical protein